MKLKCFSVCCFPFVEHHSTGIPKHTSLRCSRFSSACGCLSTSTWMRSRASRQQQIWWTEFRISQVAIEDAEPPKLLPLQTCLRILTFIINSWEWTEMVWKCWHWCTKTVPDYGKVPDHRATVCVSQWVKPGNSNAMPFWDSTSPSAYKGGYRNDVDWCVRWLMVHDGCI